MRKIFMAFMSFAFIGLNAQEAETVSEETTEVSDYVKFTSSEKKYDDWSIAAYFGMPMIQGSDLNTIAGGEILWSYDTQLVLTKQISHAFGIALQGNYGRTEQQTNYQWKLRGHTEYFALSVLGDLNFSSLFRRIDNKSRYAWALHGYGGVGFLGYDAEMKRVGVTDFYDMSNDGSSIVPAPDSFFLQGGGGLRYKVNQLIDVEAKVMYVYTGDEEFDGSGNSTDPIFSSPGSYPGLHVNSPVEIYPADYEEGKDDSFWTASLGVVFKLGKHDEHLSWVDPMYELSKKIDSAENFTVCASGDKDDDGVCDDWDRELDTPLGARVDGAGRALDTDLDGVIDLNDDCVTVPGPVENNGCPEGDIDTGGAISEILEGLEFSLDSDVISPGYYQLLDQAAKYLKHYPDHNFNVEGHTDARASASYNMALSNRRAQSVVDYLVEKHNIDPSRLTVIAKGETEMRFPECKPASTCPEWKNHSNRRVVFVRNN